MTKKKIIFTILEVVFAVIVPMVLVFINYASWSEKTIVFKISIGGILLLILIAYIAKKIFIDRYVERLRAMATQHIADLKIETDEEKKKSLAEALKRERAFEAILSYILPVLLLILAFILCKLMESAAVKLSGTVGLVGASELIAAVFGVLAAREVKTK